MALGILKAEEISLPVMWNPPIWAIILALPWAPILVWTKLPILRCCWIWDMRRWNGTHLCLRWPHWEDNCLYAFGVSLQTKNRKFNHSITEVIFMDIILKPQYSYSVLLSTMSLWSTRDIHYFSHWMKRLRLLGTPIAESGLGFVSCGSPPKITVWGLLSPPQICTHSFFIPW